MGRTTVFAIVEGYSENGFLTRFLGQHLGALGVDFYAKIIGDASSKGGMKFRTFKETCEELARFLHDKRQPYVTTFFDYYGLPTSEKKGWDFIVDAKAAGLPIAKQRIEQQLLDGVMSAAGRDDFRQRFLPYLQLHELEALFFAEPNTLAQTLGVITLGPSFAKIVTECGECEMINDHPLTAPSKRLNILFPGYIKGRSAVAHAPRLAGNLSLVKVRAACPLFNSWLTRLESLGNA